LTLGGDCLVDLAPIAYLSERYGDYLAVLWVDAHPDVMGPAQFQNDPQFTDIKDIKEETLTRLEAHFKKWLNPRVQ
jgi:hypothetical protein